MDWLAEVFADYTLRTVALGSGLLGIVSGALGCFAVLRRQSLLGDAMAHAALPGIALAFLATGSKSPLVLILGALLAGWLGALFVMAITSTTRLRYDSALGLVLAVFFGFGLVLLTWIQKYGAANQAGLDKFLFGQAAALLAADVVVMAVLGALALGLVALFWKECKLLSFDPEFAATLGLPVRGLDILLTTLLVLAIVLGLQTVGVVLMSAMVVAPGAAARQWTDRLGAMVLLGGLFGALAGVAGALLSSLVPRLPTGPTIVLCASAIVLVSFLLAPNRGLVWEAVRQRRHRRRLGAEVVLTDLYLLAKQHERPDHAHTEAAIGALRGGGRGLRQRLNSLESRGWARRAGDGWQLTEAGRVQASEL
ncbi:MAG: metal ABC transporter permease, partial [Armatimonadetes bacterium]|nr:metal ABC transporter permease [Armatimonadota bacterium]